MSDQSIQSTFNWLTAIGAITAVTTVLFAMYWLLSPLLFASPQGSETAVFVGAGVAWVSSLLGLAPVALLARHGLMPIVFGYFGGAAIRVMVIIVAIVSGIIVYDLPIGPFVATLMGMYLVLLFVEVAMVSPYVWRLRGRKPERVTSGDARRR